MTDLTRDEAIAWCREHMADFHTPVFPPPSGWMWIDHGNGLVLEPIFTMTDQGDAISAVDVGIQKAGRA